MPASNKISVKSMKYDTKSYAYDTKYDTKTINRNDNLYYSFLYITKKIKTYLCNHTNITDIVF